MTAHSAIEAPRKVQSLCSPSGFVGIQWRSTLGINAKSEGAVTILTSMHFHTMPTPSEISRWFPVKVGTREAGKTNEEHGSRLQMQYCHAGEKLNIFDFSRSLSYM